MTYWRGKVYNVGRWVSTSASRTVVELLLAPTTIVRIKLPSCYDSVTRLRVVAAWSLANQSSKYRIIFARVRATLSPCYLAEITLARWIFHSRCANRVRYRNFRIFRIPRMLNRSARATVSIDVTDIYIVYDRVTLHGASTKWRSADPLILCLRGITRMAFGIWEEYFRGTGTHRARTSGSWDNS